MRYAILVVKRDDSSPAYKIYRETFTEETREGESYTPVRERIEKLRRRLEKEKIKYYYAEYFITTPAGDTYQKLEAETLYYASRALKTDPSKLTIILKHIIPDFEVDPPTPTPLKTIAASAVAGAALSIIIRYMLKNRNKH